MYFIVYRFYSVTVWRGELKTHLWMWTEIHDMIWYDMSQFCPHTPSKLASFVLMAVRGVAVSGWVLKHPRAWHPIYAASKTAASDVHNLQETSKIAFIGSIRNVQNRNIQNRSIQNRGIQNWMNIKASKIITSNFQSIQNRSIQRSQPPRNIQKLPL